MGFCPTWSFFFSSLANGESKRITNAKLYLNNTQYSLKFDSVFSSILQKRRNYDSSQFTSSTTPELKQSASHRQTPWNMSSQLFHRIKTQNSNHPFKLCEILNSDSEFKFILTYFEHQKPPGYGIKRIACIHNPDHTIFFEAGIKNMERESDNSAFFPKVKKKSLEKIGCV